MSLPTRWRRLVVATLGVLVVSAIVGMTPASAHEAFKSGHALAHDGTSLYYEVHGRGEKFLLFGGPALQPKMPGMREFVDGLGDKYRVILVEYPGEPKMYTLTPATVVRDYLKVATAAGAKKFAYFGYSWGAVVGLQIALRTDRMVAFVAGGFPMLRGPYPQMLESLQRSVFGNSVAPPHSWGEARQYLTFYEGLQSFDDSAVQDRLKMPRVNFVGTNDVTTFSGIKVNFYKMVADHEESLKSVGWDVMFVPGEDHMAAVTPRVALPLLRKWLAEHWPADQS